MNRKCNGEKNLVVVRSIGDSRTFGLPLLLLLLKKTMNSNHNHVVVVVKLDREWIEIAN